MMMFLIKNLYAYELVVLLSAASTAVAAAQSAFPKSSSEVPIPVAGAVLYEQHINTIGRMAYIWGWPMVNSLKRCETITQAPKPRKLGGVVPVATRGHL